MGFDISEMPGTAEQPMEINVLDSSWTSEVSFSLNNRGNPIFGLNVSRGQKTPHPALQIINSWVNSILPSGRSNWGVDLGEIKMHFPEEDFSWFPTLTERKYHHNSKQPPATA
ncbi:hypothetical protein B0H14DRAFT_2578167 [Mycena olivaceomarginata]|nr:hypothetical protein B0H14DRAFT_2578167 [Mycena olivaceomarginata]